MHWRGWKTSAFLLVDRVAFANGTLDLLALLRAVPGAEVRRMQAGVRAHGGRFQYSLRDYGLQDGVDVLLQAVWEDAEERERT